MYTIERRTLLDGKPLDQWTRHTKYYSNIRRMFQALSELRKLEATIKNWQMMGKKLEWEFRPVHKKRSPY